MSYPPVQGGGSLIVAWQVKSKHVLVVGGGEVAAGRILHALNADAKVTVVSPTTGLNPEVSYRIAENQVTHIDRTFEPSDLDNADMVLCAIDDPEASTQVWKLCKERRIPANIADVPPRVMVSTNGNGPRLAAIVRRKIADALPENMGAAIENVGSLRKMLRAVAPDAKEGAKRMKWMSAVCEEWELDDLVKMTEEDMAALLTHYAEGDVPPLEQVRLESMKINE
ncbi:siroheme synthase Met8 [Penicillium waksmanii]|uniref:siroheme synthase Met8 n=1 Tax=Penicillium waksmanii TaxID=69791 RepID=UPI0025467ADE|nr:siroheme synthase Met8 [Penicillium waksmanii]KAJ5984690.1 siroheme synthase Met8 [Penicillium waksmanii]